jgi:regulator of RNase E activity RraA
MVLSSANSVTHPYKSKDKLAGTIVTIQIFKKKETVTKLLAASPRMHHTDDAHRDRHAPA